MVFTSMITPEKRALVQYLYQLGKVNITDIAMKMGVSRSSIYRILRRQEQSRNKDKKIPGRKLKIHDHLQRRMIRSLTELRTTQGNFTLKQLRKEMGLTPGELSISTISRQLKRKGYKYVQARRKGVLHLKDLRQRLAFAKDMKRNYSLSLWTQDISFYLDAVSFFYKRNPFDQAKSPRGRIWRKTNEALALHCTAKGDHIGSGGKVLKIMAAISYDKGVIIAQEYDHMDGTFFAKFIKDFFPDMFKMSEKAHPFLFLQDGDPSQNSAKARVSLQSVGAKLLKIPPRSPDINPIENVFSIVRRKLREQALRERIEQESFEQFTTRVKTLILNIDRTHINNIIASMPKRIEIIIKEKGNRTKY